MVCFGIFFYLRFVNKMKIVNFIIAEDDVYAIYSNNEKMCTKYTIRLFCYILWHLQVFLAAGFFPIYCMYVGNFDTSTWPLPFNMAVPFDTSSIIGWYLLWFIQTNTAFSYCLGTIAPTAYFMNCCLYIITLCDHFNCIINSINEHVEGYHQIKNKLKTKKINLQIKEKLGRAVKHHEEILELSRISIFARIVISFLYIYTNSISDLIFF